MKIVKRLAIFSVVTLLFGTCISPPEFSIVPEIELLDVHFFKGADETAADTLKITLNFKDGDGDLGLNGDDPRYNSTPFNEKNFYLIKDGVLQSVGTSSIVLNEIETITKVVDVPDGVTGKLVTTQTPGGPPQDNCYDYGFDSLYVKAKDVAIFDMSKLVRTIPKSGTPEFYVLYDNFYYKPNKNYRNIEIAFDTLNYNDPRPEDIYEEYDFHKKLCGIIPFKDRFPVLDESNKQLDGTMKYIIKVSGLPDLFLGRQIQLRIKIKDRALHESNEEKYITNDLFE